MGNSGLIPDFGVWLIVEHVADIVAAPRFRGLLGCSGLITRTEQGTPYSVPSTCTVYCTEHIRLCTVPSTQCTVYSLHCVHSIQSTFLTV